MAATFLLFIFDEPVLDRGRGLAGRRALLPLDLDRHVLVLLQARGQVRLLGRLGRLGQREGGDLPNRVGLLDRRRLVRLEFLEIELLDEVGCWREDGRLDTKKLGIRAGGVG